MKNIANCETTKDAWDRLQVKNEGTDIVKKTRLRRLITDYENLVMHDDETIADFRGRLCDVTNECFALGKIYIDAKLVRKVLCSLPKRFMSKVTSIEECHDLDEMQLNELIGSLQTLELSLKRWDKKSGKGLVLKHEVISKSPAYVDSSNIDDDEYALLAENFAKFLKKNIRKPSEGKKGKQPFVKKFYDQTGQGGFLKKNLRDYEKKSKGIKCFECEGYGHIQSECANTLKKKDKAMAATLSEREDSENGGDDSNEDENYLAFAVNQEDSDSVSSDGSCDVCKEQHKAYDKMYESWLKAIKKIKSLESEKCILIEDKKILNDKLKVLFPDLSNKEISLNQALNELTGAKAVVERLNAGSYKLDEVFAQGQTFGNKAGLDFSSKPNVITFVKASESIPKVVDELCEQISKMAKEVRFLEKGSIVIPGFPMLNDMFYVEGLKANLISISQIFDKGCIVKFSKNMCQVLNGDGTSLLEGKRSNDNCYLLSNKVSCLSSKTDCVDFQHKKLGHMNFKDLVKLSKKDVVKGLPKLEFPKGKTCGPCQQGKQTKSPHKPLSRLTTTGVVELLHMDLIGPMQTESLEGKKLQMEQNCQVKKVVRIRSDHGREFENSDFSNFYDIQGIWHEFFAPMTPQQNGVVERKNRVLQEMARIMLNDKKLPTRLWTEAINTACHISNRVFLRKGTSQTPYELWKGKKPNLSYFHVFGCKCYVLNDRDHLGKFDAKSDEGVFLGYSLNSRAYRIFNMRIERIIESFNVVFSDSEDYS
ncbi:uncharacterized protein LOC116119476 [Pistacia vera]|uniref:uncharacterized protein LOC116119476 n=1 Tax=Pistacia vera TaxID=55513 RepID=UPI0012630111|nr:uncharacterized protein LOC116119476 [Pistacia vera]